jgi:hypothetical protein
MTKLRHQNFDNVLVKNGKKILPSEGTARKKDPSIPGTKGTCA